MTKRPTLSSVLPAKGEGTRPEPLPESGRPSMPSPNRANAPERKATTFKIRADIYARLRAASFHENRDKQDITDEALDEWLTKHGYS